MFRQSYVARFVATRAQIAKFSTVTAADVTETRGASFGTLRTKIDGRILDVIEHDLKYQYMTHDQETMLPDLLTGDELLVQIKPGHMRTLVFLVSVIQRLLESNKEGEITRGVKVLIIVPTEKTARKISMMGKRLVSHLEKIKIHALVGPDAVRKDEFYAMNPDIVVTTAGFMGSFLKDSEIAALFSSSLELLTLFDTDVLATGYRMSVVETIRGLPREKRRTVLFSVTTGLELTKLVQTTLKSNYKLISTISAEETPDQRLPEQCVYTLGHDEPEGVLPVLAQMLLQNYETDKDKFKAVVYMPTSRQTKMFGFIFRQNIWQGKLPQIEIYCEGMTLPEQTNAIQAFNNANSAVLFIEPGHHIKFYNVTHVIQPYLPASAEQYLSRIRQAIDPDIIPKAYTILYPFEHRIFDTYDDLKNLPIKMLPCADVGLHMDTDAMVEEAMRALDPRQKDLMRKAVNKYYSRYRKKVNWTRKDLANWAWEMAVKGWGMPEWPNEIGK